MEDTSFAIHPDREEGTEAATYHDIGDVVEWKKAEQGALFHCENGYVFVQFYREDILRITMNPKTVPVLEQSLAIASAKEQAEVDIQSSGEGLIIQTEKLTAILSLSPFRLKVTDAAGRLLLKEEERGMAFRHDGEVRCFKKMEKEDHFYGLGEKTGFLDKRGEKLTMWNSDVFAPHNPETDALYQSVPFFMTIREGKAHGVFLDNTFKTIFDFKREQARYFFSAEGGELDYYIMAGPSPKEVIEQYSWLTGRMELPPKWAIGYHQSRYSYKTAAEVRELVAAFKEKDIPLDAVFLDIHYMDGYRVFTFDQDRFPRPEALIQELSEEGIHVVPIVDPGVKKDPESPVYIEGIRGGHFCQYAEGDLYTGEVWPGISVFPDFFHDSVRQWWGEQHKFYTDMGIEGIWNDMNEPAVFNETKTMDLEVLHNYDGELKTHRELHNAYGLFMGMATYQGLKQQLNGKRPFLLTRAGFSGIQRYAAVWTGDNRSFWEHLQMSMPMCMNLGISGIPFSGADVGGFAHDAAEELLVRWTQLGAFMPYFRNHSNLGTVRQEPWSFGDKAESIIKQFIQLRYRWLPYIYTLFREAHQTGMPVMRALILEYPDDIQTVNLSDQFLLGEHVLVAPITKPNTSHRAVYLPEGEWYDYWTDQKMSGKRHILAEAEWDQLPLFIKEGAILPQADTFKPADQLSIHIYPGNEVSEFLLYDDDGETFAYQNGDYFELNIKAWKKGSTAYIEIDERHSGYTPTWKDISINVHGAVARMVINGKEQ
ncbi:glycoside hydrolase family 31 protein [Bacillus xiapuensis]|uniref:glycoside hydrolase family 31 protein n=1 Tax=Bacillus xiapuensis TaxID=2014075 RepID=UPI000C23106A|nr:TIM-barrel domain-containing protein [Bacillus xiapuensis]